jgi:hypothetical protein
MKVRVGGDRIGFETDLEEGTPVALTAEDEEELFLAYQDIERGNFEDGDELLREIRSWGKQPPL